MKGGVCGVGMSVQLHDVLPEARSIAFNSTGACV